MRENLGSPHPTLEVESPLSDGLQSIMGIQREVRSPEANSPIRRRVEWEVPNVNDGEAN